MLKDLVICVVGAGNMGAALIRGLAGKVKALHVLEKDQRSLDKLATQQVVHGPPPRPPDILLMAVKPQDMPDSMAELQNLLGADTLFISIAAGLELATLSRHLPQGQPLVRAMPNVGAMVMRSVTAVCANAQTSPAQMELACELFTCVGQCVRVEERHMNAVTALSGSGPGYVAIIMEALCDAGVAQGLPRNTARELAVHALLGACELVSQLNLHPAQLKDMVTSPGGTTIHGIMALEQGGLRGIIMQAVQAAVKRGQELA